jgi:4-oxalomesaconate tautomerase
MDGRTIEKIVFNMQTAIPYMHFRGGSSKGLYFNAKDLPTDETLRNKYILAAIEGSDLGDARQIDGLGGGSSLSSKVAIVSPSNTEGVDLDYYFIQVMIGKGKVSTNQTCGNILAGVLPFAIESGMIEATHPTTKAIISIVNTGGICEVIVETPNGQVNYAGNAKVDGVLGTAAPIICNYLDTEGATCGALLPTGNPIDIVDGKEITCIDNGMPVVLMRATDFGITGYETKTELDDNILLKQQVENIRLQAGFKMNLGDVTNQSVPKMCLISPPITEGGLVNTRMFIPHVCHDAIGVLAAVSVVTACKIPKTVCRNVALQHRLLTKDEEGLTLLELVNLAFTYSIEHPTGYFTVSLQARTIDNKLVIEKSGVMRTARLLSKGVVFIPESVTMSHP